VATSVAVTAGAAQCAGTGAVRRRSHTVGADLPLEPGAGSGQRVSWDVFVNMDGLCMLPQIVKTREAPRAMALERALASVLADVSSQMLAPCETQVAGWVVGAKEALSFLLFGGHFGITVDALVFRDLGTVVVTAAHFHILRTYRLRRSMRAFSDQATGRCADVVGGRKR
jgi:hypothetical protein